MSECQFKIGDTVRNTRNGTLFVMTALPRPRDLKKNDLGDPRMTVHYKDAPEQIRSVDPAAYEIAPAGKPKAA